jgi:AcrR family transcriptional regulator
MKEKRRYSSEDDPTSDRILKAALDSVATTSIGELSVRAIAAAAEVNVATVHYYFRTKDAVIAAALGRFFEVTLAGIREIFEAESGPREKLVAILDFYMTRFHENPGVFASLVEAILTADRRGEGSLPSDCDRILIEAIASVKPNMMALVATVTGVEDKDEDEEELKLKILRMMTSLMHPILITTLPSRLLGLDFADPALRRRYIEAAVDSL